MYFRNLYLKKCFEYIVNAERIQKEYRKNTERIQKEYRKNTERIQKEYRKNRELLFSPFFSKLFSTFFEEYPLKRDTYVRKISSVFRRIPI
jgi:hypothetical protein